MTDSSDDAALHDARAAVAWTRDTIGDATRAWLAALPPVAEVDGVGLVHGSPRDPLREYVTDRQAAAENLAELPDDDLRAIAAYLKAVPPLPDEPK